MTVCNMTASLRDLALSHLLIQYVHVFELFFSRREYYIQRDRQSISTVFEQTSFDAQVWSEEETMHKKDLPFLLL